MSFLKIFLWRCKKNWFFEILLVVQLWFFIVGMLIMTGSIQKYTMGIRLLDKVEGLKDAWYWSIDDSAYIKKQTDLERTNQLHGHDESAEEHGRETEGYNLYLERIMDLAMDTGAFAGIGNMNFSHFSTPKAEVDLILYNEAMVNNIKLPIIKGEWLTKRTKSGAPGILIDKTVAKQYPVGSLVEGTFEYWDFSTEELTMEVVGIIDLEGHSFDFFTGGNGMRADDFFTPVLGYAIMAESDFPLDYEPNSGTNKMLFPKASVSSMELEKALGYIETYGWVVNMDDIRNNSIKEFKFHFGYDIPTNSMMFIIGALGLLGHMVLSAIESRRENAVYFILGAKPRWISGVEWLRYGLLFVIPSIASWFYYDNIYTWHSYKTHTTFWFGWGISIGVVILAMLIASRSKVGAHPVDTLRRWE